MKFSTKLSLAEKTLHYVDGMARVFCAVLAIIPYFIFGGIISFLDIFTKVGAGQILSYPWKWNWKFWFKIKR